MPGESRGARGGGGLGAVGEVRVLALLPRKFKNGNSVRWAARILTKHPLASAGVVARCACVAFWWFAALPLSVHFRVYAFYMHR